MFFAFPLSNAQWVSAKKKPTQFNSNKNRPKGDKPGWKKNEPTVKP